VVCGRSQKQPFCDGSHKVTSFTPVEFKAATTEKVWFCACKRSGKKPMCDGTHKTVERNAPLNPPLKGEGRRASKDARRGGVMCGSRTVGDDTPVEQIRRASARRLRANATETELSLWKSLRTIEIDGSLFRRQVPIGPYVVDFACMAARLVIELDGSGHNIDARQVKDDRRTRWLEAEGYRVIRFWNNDLRQNANGVLETVYAALYGSRDADPFALKHKRRQRRHPTPARSARRPSPSRGG
jgi:very-short-patch-repair endonuclease/CDGSH-type Zn-finger protein